MLAEYKWSSYRSYVGLCSGPDWLVSEPMLALIGGHKGGRRQRYREYVDVGIAEDDAEFQTALRRSARSIGDEDFREEVDARYGALLSHRRRPEDVALRHTAAAAVPAAEVLTAVAKTAGVDVGELNRRRRESPLRAIAACLLVRHAGQTQREVALLLGLQSGSSVSCQLRRLAELAKDDRRVSDLITRAERRLARETQWIYR